MILHLIKTDNSGNITQEKTFKSGGGNQSANSIQQTFDGGYIIANWGYIIKTDVSFNVQWVGGFSSSSIGEFGTTIHQTIDGGYIVSTDLRNSNPGDTDFLLTKLDVNGNTQWSKKIATSNSDIEYSTKQTMDGGYIICGENYNNVGQGTPSNICIVKTDASGGVLWSNTIGGTSNDKGTDIIQISSGEYIVTGTTNSFGVGQADIFLMKLSSTGNILWAKTYGGSGVDEGGKVLKSNDGGYILSGYTESYDSSGAGDILLIKTDSIGNILWSKTYGSKGTIETAGESGVSLVKTSDGGYLCVVLPHQTTSISQHM